MAADDQEVEAWYLEGWCFFLMAEQAREGDGSVDGLTWQELARDARDCLETCRNVSSGGIVPPNHLTYALLQLHTTEQHPDIPLLEHTKELIGQLEDLGISPSPEEVIGEDGAPGDDNDEDWEDEDDDSDVEMS